MAYGEKYNKRVYGWGVPFIKTKHFHINCLIKKSIFSWKYVFCKNSIVGKLKNQDNTWEKLKVAS
jgi:hypothetical protein